MASTQITQSLQVFTDLTGQPLDAGYIYVGQANQNPETNPIAVYWDAELTQPAAQPLRTVSGYISRQGTPASIYAASSYSITVKTKTGELVYYKSNVVTVLPDASVTTDMLVDGSVTNAKLAAPVNALINGAVQKQQLDALTVGRLLGVTNFTSRGSYTPNPLMAFCIVEVQGGGAGGGGAQSTAGNAASGSGGGGGGYISVLLTAAQVSTYLSGGSVAITVGGGGTGGSGLGTSAISGGSSRFGSNGPLATGGSIGVNKTTGSTAGYVAGGAGGGFSESTGGATGTTLFSTGGGIGGAGWWSSGTFASAPEGGSGAFCPGGAQVIVFGASSSGAGRLSPGPGAGGYGAAVTGPNTLSGGDGSPGYVKIWEYS